MYALKHFLSIDNSMRHCGREYNKKDCPSPGRFPQGGQSFICEKNYYEENYFEKNYFEENYFGNDDPKNIRNLHPDHSRRSREAFPSPPQTADADWNLYMRLRSH